MSKHKNKLTIQLIGKAGSVLPSAVEIVISAGSATKVTMLRSNLQKYYVSHRNNIYQIFCTKQYL